MRRVSVVGCSGAGKSTLAAELGALLGVDHVELDALFHRPGWTPAPDDEFRADLVQALSADAWVVDGNYSKLARPIVWAAADTIVWLDLPRFVVLRSVLGRTLRRIVRREELWNGNRERWSNFFDPRPKNNVVLWSWTRHPRYARQMRDAMQDPSLSHVNWVRLRSRDDARDWIREQRAGLA